MISTVGILKRLAWIDRVVAYVWVFLSLLMVMSFILLYNASGMSRESGLVVALLVATWTYPIYTLG